jgi:hypothetical protein
MTLHPHANERYSVPVGVFGRIPRGPRASNAATVGRPEKRPSQAHAGIIPRRAPANGQGKTRSDIVRKYEETRSAFVQTRVILKAMRA